MLVLFLVSSEHTRICRTLIAVAGFNPPPPLPPFPWSSSFAPLPFLSPPLALFLGAIFSVCLFIGVWGLRQGKGGYDTKLGEGLVCDVNGGTGLVGYMPQAVIKMGHVTVYKQHTCIPV